MCAIQWFTPTIGFLYIVAKQRVTNAPTDKGPAIPGPFVYQKRSISLRVNLDYFKAIYIN